MADMPDMSAYGIQAPGPSLPISQVAGIQAPGLTLTPVQAPMSAPGAPIPTYNVPQVPTSLDYNLPQQAPAQQQIALPQRSRLPTLADIITSQEQKSGKPLSQQEFHDVDQWYKTNVLTPALWNVKGANKDKVAAEVAAYNDAVKREMDKRYGNQKPAATNLGAVGAFIQGVKGGLERGGAGLSTLLGGAINLGGLAPNSLGDYLLSQANPDQANAAQAELPSLLADRQKLLAFYANNPTAQAHIHAQLDPKIQAIQGTAGNSNLVEAGNKNIGAAYDSGHPIAATLGVAGGQLAPFLLTRGAGTAALAAGEAAGNVGSNAASQLNRGDSLGQVETQAIPDAALQTLMAYLPTKFAGNIVSRALKGAGTAGGVATAQQIIDKAINSKNDVSPENIAVAAALGAGLSALHGSGVSAILSKLGKKTPTADNIPPSTGGAKPSPAPKNVVDDVEADMTPKQAYTDLLNNNVTTEGLPDNEFGRLNNNIQKQAELMAKKFKPPSSFDTPEDLVDASIKYAKALTKNKFYEMTPDQREELVGNLASWFGKRAKMDSGDISNAILGLRTIPASENATTTPPPEPTTQVPEQTAQTANPDADLPGGTGFDASRGGQSVVDPFTGQNVYPNDPKYAQVVASKGQYTPNTKYDPIWEAAIDTNTPVSQLPQEMQGLATQVRNGRIPNRQAFDNVLQTAEVKAGNKLKTQPKQNVDTTSFQPPETQTTQTEAPDTRKVSDVLASRSTKTSEVNLRKQLRTMLKASGAKDDELNKLKSLSVKSLLEKAKATKNKQILAKTRVEPVENPDEVTPAPKNKLKKQVKAPKQEDADTASLYAAKNNIPYAFMSSISKAYDLSPEEVGAVWNRYKDAGLVKLDKKNPQNYSLKNDNLTKEDMVRSTLDDARAAGEVEGSPPPKSQAPAKGSAGANKQTPLEKLLQERLGDRLPKERLDELHNAIETAQTGDNNDLTDIITGLKDSGDINKNEVKWLKDLPKRGVAHDLTDETPKSRRETLRDLSIGKLAKLEPQSQQESFYKKNALAWRSALLRQGVDEITANRLTSKEARELWSSNERTNNEKEIQKLAASKSKEIDSGAKKPIVFKKVEVRPTPLGGGVSNDGSTLYVDPAIPESINVKRADGTNARVVLYDRNDPTVGGLAVHEGNEFPQMKERGKNYNKAHDENANHAEDEYYKIKYGVSRAAVDKALKPYLDRAESESANHPDIPDDLDRTPYEDSGKAHLLDKNIENNASGESSASLEAQRRVSDERAAGRTRAMIRRNGTVEPLVGVDAVDTHARAGEVVVQRGIGRNAKDWTILSHGDDLSHDAAMGKVNKAKQSLDETHEQMQTGSSKEDESIPEHTISPEEFETLYNDRTKQENNLPQRSERIAPINVKREVDNIVQNIREGSDVKETGAQLKELSDKLADRNLQRKINQMHERRRGPEWVKARLQRFIADSDPESTQYAAAKMAQWLLEQNPNIADSMAISIRALESGEAGRFNPITRLLQLNGTSLNKTTGLHELLHASERMLPDDIQDKIRGEYIGRIQNKLKKTTDPWAKSYLKNAIRNFVTPNKSDQLAMMDILKNHRDEVPANDYYKYFDTSEYWAEEGSNILARRHNADSWISKAKQWLSEFGEHIKNVFGLDNNSEVIKGLNKMLKTTEGENTMLNKGDQEARAITEDESKDYSEDQMGDDPTDEELEYETNKESDVDPNMEKEVVYDKNAQTIGDFSNYDKVIEKYANTGHGLEKAIQHAYNKNVPVTDDNDIFAAFYRAKGLRADTQANDKFEVVDPANDWVHANHSKFANSVPEAYDRINEFYGAKNMLERAETAWYMESPLDGTAEIDRASILEKLNDGDITRDKARTQLRKLATNHSILDWEQYAESKGTDIESIKEVLDNLKSKGVDEDSLAGHNELTQDIRNRLRDNLIKSGDVAESDPYVGLYDWKWYVPLKGSPFGGKVDGNFDLIPDRNIALARLNKQIAVMKGRKSLVDKPYFRLLVDLARSANRVGHKEIMDKLYNLLTTEGSDGQLALKKYGAKIDVWHGFQKKGYTNEKGKQVDRLKAPANGVIINDGDTHYVVTLPHNSELLRGLIQMDNVKQPSAGSVTAKIRPYTNTLARLYTTINPRWVIGTQFIRDLTFVPMSVGVERFDNPLQAIPFMANYGKEMLGAYNSLSAIIPMIAGSESALREAAKSDPTGWAASTLEYRKNGGATFFTHSFDVGGVEKELLNRAQNIDGIMDVGKYGLNQVLKYTGNLTDTLTQLPRIAAFRVLLREGMSAPEAAVQARKILDYEQSGTHGKLLNAWYAFFRVGATSTDFIRQAFTAKNGKINYPKLLKWQLFAGALGYISYMAGMSLLGKDNDGKDKISKVNPDLLTSKMFFPLGDKIGSVNLGLGIPQIFMAPGILAAALEQGHITPKDAIGAYLHTVQRNGPIKPGGALGTNPTDYLSSALYGFVPTVATPIIDINRNVSSFSSPIHTADPDKNKYASDQGYPNTAAAWKDVATWMRTHTDGAVDMFPEDIKFLVESYGGSPAVDFTRWAFENGDQAAGGSAPLGRLAGTVQVDTSHYMSRDLFDTMDTLAESSKRYNHLVSNAMHNDGLTRDQAKAKVAEVTSRDPAFAKRLEAYQELLKAHKNYNAEVNSLRDNKLLSDTRKQLVRKQADSQLRKSIEKAQTVIDNTEK